MDFHIINGVLNSCIASYQKNEKIKHRIL